MRRIRFCAYQYADQPLDELIRRWKGAGELGYIELERDLRTIWHSLVVFPPLTRWESIEYFRDVVGRYGEIGIDEFVLYWPRKWREAPHEDAVLEHVCHEAIPTLREA